MTHYRIVHRTEYRYSSPITTSHTVAHLRPRSTPRQRVITSDITIDPEPAVIDDHRDAFGNPSTYWSIEQPHTQLSVLGTSEVEVEVATAPSSSPPWDQVAALVGGDVSDDGLLARLCAVPTPLTAPTPELRDFAARSFPPGRLMQEGLADLCSRIYTGFAFDPTATDVTTAASQVLADRRGVCQDFAHLTIAALRSLRLPARYVSGYLETAAPPGMNKLVGADASHAWCSAFVPGEGWVDLDPTNDQLPPRHHITVAWGRDYTDVAPVRGVVFGPPAHQALEVSVEVSRVHP